MCAASSIIKAMELTPTPPGNDFLEKDEIGRDEPAYPLELYYCENCSHLQLGHVVDAKILYQKNYTYVSRTSSEFVKHLQEYALEMIERFKIKPKSLIVDIGSNDGTCLSFFKDHDMKVLGIDPATDIADKATKSGVETVGDFFSKDLAVKLRETHGKADFITSHNACAHIDNLLDIVEGVDYLLDEKGIFVVEVGYLVDVYKNTWFDTIYHEHLDFHTLAPFEKLFELVGMEVISAQRISPQGGSIRIISQKKNGPFKRDASVNELINIERELGLHKAETYNKFEKKISLVKGQLKQLVNTLKSSGKTIAGFGAPTKATTLMRHFGLDETVIDFIVDDNPLKQGLFTPISHIPVLSTEALYDRKPDYVLILAWNFAAPIMKAHKKYSDEIGEFILPMPVPQIVNLSTK
jgi:SAM-dependent methyltransferase